VNLLFDEPTLSLRVADSTLIGNLAPRLIISKDSPHSKHQYNQCFVFGPFSAIGARLITSGSELFW
jgi:hypothetical protein